MGTRYHKTFTLVIRRLESDIDPSLPNSQTSMSRDLTEDITVKILRSMALSEPL